MIVLKKKSKWKARHKRRRSKKTESAQSFFWRMLEDVLKRARVWLSLDQVKERLLARGVSANAIGRWLPKNLYALMCRGEFQFGF